uniref:Uncharacterized protein n=1 Tax=Jaculus jaculus TaxID=51337 RepID=A0A8C5K033_JACJA
MAEQVQQQQMKTSFLFIQLQPPAARAIQVLPAQSPASAASTAAPRGLEEGHIFSSPRTGFLTGQNLRSAQGSAPSPWSLLPGEGPGTRRPAAFNCCALKGKKEGQEKPQNPDVRRGGACGSPHGRCCLATVSRKLGPAHLLSCRLSSPAPAVSVGSSSPPMAWEPLPVIPASQNLCGMDPQARNVFECSIPQTTLAHAAGRGEGAVLTRGATSYQVLPKNFGEGIGTALPATRARLCRYCPTIQIGQSCPAPPAALPLKKLRPKALISEKIKTW